MPQPAPTSLLRAATSTFESLALLFPEACSADGAAFIPLAAAFSVSYHGADHGRVVVGVTSGVLRALAENMLGSVAAPDPDVQRDALGELVNVVTGNVLPMVHGAAAVFALDAPALAGDAPFTALDGESQVALLRLQMDEGDALVALFSRGAATADEAHSMPAAARA